MKIPNELFQQALRSTSSIASLRPSADDGIKYIKLEAARERFKMTGNGSGNYAFAEIECDGDLKPICVAAHSLKNIAQLFDKNVVMDLTGSTLKIRSGGSYTLNTVSTDEFPTIPLDKLTKIGVNCKDLAECIDAVKFAIRTSDERPGLYGVNIKLAAKTLIAQATTGIIIARMEKAGIAAECEYLIPYPFVGNFISALRNDGAVLSASDARVLVEYENGCYSCTLATHKFPALDNQLKGKHPKIGEFKPVEWLSTFRKILAMAGGDGKLRCDVTVKDGRMKYDGKQGSVDRATDKLSKILRLNASTFTACLEAFGDNKVVASMYDQESGGGALRLDHGDLTVLSTQV